MPKKFPCATGPALEAGRKGCGACCYFAPWEDPGTPCRVLDLETHLCRLYDIDGVDMRPPVCSVRGVWERNGQGVMTWYEFIEANLDACARMIPEVITNRGEAAYHLVMIGR